MGKNYSQDIVNVIREFLDSDGWKYSFDSERGFFRFGLNSRSQLRRLDFIIDVKDDEYLVYGMLPVGGEKEDFETIAKLGEFVCRVNYGLKNGCFEFDWDDGELRFKTYVDCAEQLPSRKIIRNSIYCVASMTERYSQGIIGILFLGDSAREAADMCEQPMRSRMRRAPATVDADDFDPDLFGEEGDGE